MWALLASDSNYQLYCPVRAQAQTGQRSGAGLARAEINLELESLILAQIERWR